MRVAITTALGLDVVNLTCVGLQRHFTVNAKSTLIIMEARLHDFFHRAESLSIKIIWSRAGISFVEIQQCFWGSGVVSQLNHYASS
ncbi:hypothetical protein AWU82_17170 [Pseudomonas glycinae]|uniref:Uncharacterized protein n=1 Tax=Pseudomonas glycinae TaxID=1785145 RepID=A0ABM5ZMR1_9PSED|nr:hypothetical protein AWU82_17170 [Pseudomonas glycinae]